MNNKILLLLYFFLLSFVSVKAQAPFYSDIQTFKKQDSAAFPTKNAILFVGSSSFTKWTDVQDYFPGYPIINRGFGGSSLPDLIRYVNHIIIPYHPKQIIIYCGENDIAGSDTTVNGKVVSNRFKQLFLLIKKQLPAAAIGYVSMKPSPGREKLWPEMIDGNSRIKKMLAKQKNTAFIDVYHSMFNKDGTVMKDIFIEDNLHMNAKGYAIWQKIIAPYLIK
jgi:lysophospholipase L1-like esterase